LTPIKPLLKFALSIALLSLIWALATQTDKLILSKMLSLADYGYFTLAILVAGGVNVVSAPVSNVIMPRLATLEAENNHDELIRVYRQTTQLVSIVAGSATVTMVLYAEPLLWAWTSDLRLAHHVAPILQLYAEGNAILAVSAFPYYLQYAKGDLKLHLIGNLLLITLLIPFIIWSVSQYGALGAGYAWLLVNAIYFILWIPLVHLRFEKKLHLRWLIFDVLIIFLVTTLTGYGLSITVSVAIANRWWQLSIIVMVGVLVMSSGILSSSLFWNKVNSWLSRYCKKKKLIQLK
jgi:O-antigen/teichoic acid export membrane protein